MNLLKLTTNLNYCQMSIESNLGSAQAQLGFYFPQLPALSLYPFASSFSSSFGLLSHLLHLSIHLVFTYPRGTSGNLPFNLVPNPAYSRCVPFGPCLAWRIFDWINFIFIFLFKCYHLTFISNQAVMHSPPTLQIPFTQHQAPQLVLHLIDYLLNLKNCRVLENHLKYFGHSI